MIENVLTARGIVTREVLDASVESVLKKLGTMPEVEIMRGIPT